MNLNSILIILEHECINVGLLEWFDQSMRTRSVQIIFGLLKKINTIENDVQELASEEIEKKNIILKQVMCGFR